MNERRRLGLPGLLMALLVLGAASALAALQITNVTMWAINATAPPVQKYPGTDANAYPDNIMVKSYVDEDGFNVTYIYVLGYVGDITNYTDVLRVCNKYASSPVIISMRFVGLAADKGYAKYIKQFVVYDPKDPHQWVGFTYTGQTVKDPVRTAALLPGECVKLGVSVLVSGNLPSTAWNNSVGTAVPPTEYLAVYQINIITTMYPWPS